MSNQRALSQSNHNRGRASQSSMAIADEMQSIFFREADFRWSCEKASMDPASLFIL